MESVKFIFLGIVVFCVVAEAIWSHRRKKDVYNLKDSMANLGIMIGNNLLRPLSLAWGYLIFSMLEPLQIFTLPVNIATIVLTFLISEFAYYWYHRLSHELPVLWTIHHTHHSSPWMNFTTALRLNWLGKFIGPVFFLPFVLLGLSPEIMVACLTIGLLYQFFLHTEAIGKLGLVEGKIFNTPSSHRVHHGSNERYIDKNYGAVLIIYDRLFGTYEPETEKVKYGVTTGFVSHNPFRIVFQPVWDYLNGRFKREKAVLAESLPQNPQKRFDDIAP